MIMILQNEKDINSLFENDGAFRHCVMASIVMTPKLTMLLDIIQQQYKKGRIAQYAEENRRTCKQYINNALARAADSASVDVSILRTTANLYAIYDDAIIAAKIQDKITAWKTAYVIALRQKDELCPFRLENSLIPMSKMDFCQLSNKDISNELLDYAEEIEAWIDVYFSEDFDNYSAEDDAFDGILGIMASLRILASELDSM